MVLIDYRCDCVNFGLYICVFLVLSMRVIRIDVGSKELK